MSSASVAKTMLASAHPVPAPHPASLTTSRLPERIISNVLADVDKKTECIIMDTTTATKPTTTTTPTTAPANTRQHYEQEATTELSIISQPIVIASSSTSPATSGATSHYLQRHHLDDRLPPQPQPQSSVLPPGAGQQTNQILLNQQQASGGPNQPPSGQWMVVAAQTTQGMRHRMSLASDQLGISLRQLYASASSITDVPPSYHNIPGIVPYYHGRSSGPPPSYDDVINPYAPPPTYQSLFGQMREARKTSRGFLDLLQRLLIILISTLGCTILIAFMILIPFTMIIVGAVYIDECRVEHIPAFLLVGGLVWASKNIIHCYAQCQHPATSGGSSSSASTEPPPSPSEFQHQQSVSMAATSQSPNFDYNTTQNYQSNNNNHQQQNSRQQNIRLKSSICESLLNCILFGWFIAGCVIVFRNYEPDFDNQDSLRYCHRTVYMYTFWLITSAIIISGLFIGCICCLMVSSAIAGRQEDDLA